MKKILASLALLLLPSGLLAQAVPSQVWNYTDASGNQIPFTFGVDTSRVYRLTFPANITSTLQNEVLALPQFNNYSVSGANPTVTVGPILPPAAGQGFITSVVAVSSFPYSVTSANYGNLIAATTGTTSNCTLNLPATPPWNGWYVLVTKADSGSGNVRTLSTGPAFVTNDSVQGQTSVVWTDGTSWYSSVWVDTIDASGNVTVKTTGYIILNAGSGLGTILEVGGGGGFTVGGNVATPTNANVYALGTSAVPFASLFLGGNAGGNAPAGSVGEYVSSTIAQGSAVSLTSPSASNVTSISLTAGDWDVSAVVIFNPAASTSITVKTAGVSTNSGAFDALTNGAGDTVQASTAASVPVGNTSVEIPPTRISISSTTTVYLVAASTFTVSTNAAYGTIRARRVR